MKHSFSDLGALRRDPLKFFLDKTNETAPLVRLNIGLSPVYMLNDAALIKPLLKAVDQLQQRFLLLLEPAKLLSQCSILGLHRRHFARQTARREAHRLSVLTVNRRCEQHE